jgi:hypothetical protein
LQRWKAKLADHFPWRTIGGVTSEAATLLGLLTDDDRRRSSRP